MLDSTMHKLATMYENHPQRGTDGLMHQMDTLTRISIPQGHLLAGLYAEIKPKLSIEIGLAYGFSTLFFLDAAAQIGGGRHIAIDPFEETAWHGIGCQAVKELNFDNMFEHIPDTSILALTKMYKEGVKSDYIYIDGAHNFDFAMVDFFCSNLLLNVGGVVVLDDTWMPSIQKVVSFIRTNLKGHQEVTTPVVNVACFVKIKEDSRLWDHFTPF
jgi:predicted O-methyltransferase YrrM